MFDGIIDMHAVHAYMNIMPDHHSFDLIACTCILQKYSCLHVAVMFGHTEIVNLLLNAGEEMYCDYTGNDQVSNHNYT